MLNYSVAELRIKIIACDDIFQIGIRLEQMTGLVILHIPPIAFQTIVADMGQMPGGKSFIPDNHPPLFEQFYLFFNGT